MDYFPDNTMTDFRIQLAKRVDLDGRYEVALTSLQYTRSWNNITDGNNKVTVFVNGRRAVFFIPIGYYGSPNELSSVLTHYISKSISRLGERHTEVKDYIDAVKSEHEFIKINYREKNRRMAIIMRMHCALVLHPKIAQMLGFKETMICHPKSDCTHDGSHDHITKPEPVRDTQMISDVKNDPIIIVSAKEVDMEQGLYVLYVYCDLVEGQIVGDSLVPLLKAVPVDGEHGANTTKDYINPQYVPVAINHFSQLHLLLRDDAGDRVPFERGRVTATLHFRRRMDF